MTEEILQPITISQNEQQELLEASYDVSADFAKVMDKQPSIIKAKEHLKNMVEQSKTNNLMFKKEINTAGLFIEAFKKTKTGFENLRKAVKKPSFDYGKSIDAYFKDWEYEKELERLESGVKKWIKAEEAERKRLEEEERVKEEEKLKAEQKRIQEKKKQELIDSGVDVEEATIISERIETPLPAVDVQPKSVNVSSVTTANLRTRYKKTWEVVDLSKVPQKYFILDEKAVNEVRRSYPDDAESIIPGIKFDKEPIISR